MLKSDEESIKHLNEASNYEIDDDEEVYDDSSEEDKEHEFSVQTIDNDAVHDDVGNNSSTRAIGEQSKQTIDKTKISELMDYQCDVCDKKMHSTFKTFTLHQKLHDPNKCFTCEYCGKIYVHRHLLKSHIMLHKGLKPYACRFCGHRSRLKTSNVIHERIHTKEKKYKCDQCDHVSTTSSSLNKHKLSAKHANGTFLCHICEKTSTSINGLNEHMKTHNPDSRCICPICDKEFMLRKYMTRHLRMVHKNIF